MPILELSDRFLVVSAGRKLCVFDFPLQEEVNPVFCYNIPLPAVGGGDKQGEREDNDDPASAEVRVLCVCLYVCPVLSWMRYHLVDLEYFVFRF